MDRKEIGWNALDWNHLTLDTYKRQAVVHTVINLRAPYNPENFLAI
jgi:hypothetical protein